MTTLIELKSELAKVDQLLYATWLQEREAARKRIAELAVEFQLSSATVLKDVEAALLKAGPASATFRPPRVDLPLREQGAARHVEIKYRNPASGDYWKGRGPRPRWLREAVAAGAELDDFLVRGQNAAASDPLQEFEDAARRTQLARRV